MADIASDSQIQERATRAVLKAVSQSHTLLSDFVLKGGYTLFHVYGNPRRSFDLDFTAIKPFSGEVTPEKNELLHAFCGILEEEMAQAARAYGLETMRVHWREFSEERPTLLARIGYAEERAQREDFDQYVETQVTLSEIICETARATISDIPVHIPVLEDILADKLKALLQQVARSVGRKHDLYDVWYFTVCSGLELDLDKLSQYFLIKSANSPEVLPATRNGFYHPALLEYAAKGYENIVDNLLDPSCIVPAGQAYEEGVLALVNRMALPG